MATNTWVGITDTNWGDTPAAISLNWSTGFVPTVADDVVINGTAPGDVVLNGNAQCKSIDFTSFPGQFDMGSFALRHEGNCKFIAGTPILNPGVLKTGTTCTITLAGLTVKGIEINAAVTPAVVTLAAASGGGRVTDSLRFVNNIANRFHMLASLKIIGGSDGAGLFCEDNSLITSSDVDHKVIEFTVPDDALACSIKPPLAVIPLKLRGTNGIVKLAPASGGTVTALRVYTMIHDGAELDFNGMNLTCEYGVQLSLAAVWTHVGGRTITVLASGGSNALRFTAEDVDLIGTSKWYLNITLDDDQPSIVFGGTITYCDATGSGRPLYAIYGAIDGGHNPGVQFGIHATSQAGADQSVPTGDSVVLSAVAGYQEVPDLYFGTSSLTVATYTWSKTSGPGTVTFVDDSLLATSATMNKPGTYVLRMTVDDQYESAYDELTVVCVGPTVDAGADLAQDDGDSTAALLGVIDDHSALAPFTPSGYLWTQVGGPGTATIASPTALATNLSALSDIGIYTFRLTVTYAAFTITDTVRVTILDPNAGDDGDSFGIRGHHFH